ncbi:hypothetical protein N9Q55_03360 [Flavobacteriaceae bacterium]|nr:hypothetical protein [Flavobacteriaceae bacterium]
MYTNEKGKSITLGSLIAKGGEGEVYNISGDKNNCVKLYRERFRTKEKESKLKYMTNNSPQDIEGQSHKVCWPKEIIYEDGKFVGFLMPRAFEDSLLPYHLCQLKISKKIDSKWHETFDRDSIKGTISRLKLCVNIIAAVNRIHATNKYVIVDLKPQNLMVSPSGKVSIIDMDSVQITENEEVLFKAPVSTPEYTPPEVSGVIKKQIAISKDWDIFSLGVLIYEILCGIHPYVGSAKPPNEGLNTIQEKIKINLTHVVKGEDVFQTLPSPQKTYYSFDLDLKNIFKQIFKPYKLGVSTRPSLEEFGGILFNTVIALEEGFKEEIKRKLQEEKIQKKLFESEAIKNYKTVKSENLELNEKVKNINETIESLKKENKAFKSKSEKPLENSKLIIAFLGIALVITLTTLGIFNNDKSKQINYYEKTVERLRKEQQDLIKNNRSLTEEKQDLIKKNLSLTEVNMNQKLKIGSTSSRVSNSPKIPLKNKQQEETQSIDFSKSKSPLIGYLRKDPRATSKSLFTIKEEHLDKIKLLSISSENKSYFKVKVNGIEGYVDSDVVFEIQTYSSSPLVAYLRKDPTINSESLFKILEQDIDELQLISTSTKNKNYYKIKLYGIEGYINKTYANKIKSLQPLLKRFETNLNEPSLRPAGTGSPGYKFFQYGVDNYRDGNYREAKKNFTRAIGFNYSLAYYYRGLTKLGLKEPPCSDMNKASDRGIEVAIKWIEKNKIKYNCFL